MSRIAVIAKREVSSLFYSPIAYFVLFLFLTVTGLLFGLRVFVPGRPSEIRDLINFSRFGLFFIIPGVTMSLLADEYRSGRIEMLRTSPLTELDLVLGKYFGAILFYLILLVSTFVYIGLLIAYGRPDWGTTLSAYFGLLLLGMMFVSIGLFFSSLTQNQIVAYLATLLVLGFLTVCSDLAGLFPAKWGIVPIRQPLTYLGVGSHIDDFAKGIVAISHLSYFLGFTLLFLFLTYLVLESRKWR